MLEERIEEIAELERAVASSGTACSPAPEVNILTDGSLDYEDSLLERLDWVVASVHTSFRMTKENMTKRMVAAVEHPLVDCLGHPCTRVRILVLAVATCRVAAKPPIATMTNKA